MCRRFEHCQVLFLVVYVRFRADCRARTAYVHFSGRILYPGTGTKSINLDCRSFVVRLLGQEKLKKKKRRKEKKRSDQSVFFHCWISRALSSSNTSRHPKPDSDTLARSTSLDGSFELQSPQSVTETWNGIKIAKLNRGYFEYYWKEGDISLKWCEGSRLPGWTPGNSLYIEKMFVFR